MQFSKRFVTVAALGLAIAGSMTMAACSSESEAPASTAPDAPEGISVEAGRMTLPAVAGNPGAVYFTVRNASDSDRMIRSASVAGAGSALLHQTAEWNHQVDMQEVTQVSVPAGGELVFEPGGYHVMASDLADTLTAGGETEVTLTFVGGDKVSFPVELRPAGDDGAAAAQ